MNKVKFCFGIHNHQPVGNFGWVIKDAFKRSYLPFLEVLEDFPKIRISLHFTGILLDWMENKQPRALQIISRLVEKRQVELLTGAFYEPILPVIPDRDKLGQIRKQTEFTRQHFGVKPRGMWLAERVWEPHLPGILKEAGVEYTILDDIHFRYSGLKGDQLYGYYLTEEGGETVALFPISQELRYAIPFADPEKSLEYLETVRDASEGDVAIYADDGEKFGVWPETDKLCYEEKWLARFFQAITDNADWVEMRFFSEILDEVKPLGRVYLPTASYSEMNEWALPAEAIEQYENLTEKLKKEGLLDTYRAYVKGGFWRNFLSKYPESNHLHKRMLYVSDLLEANRRENRKADLEKATSHLYAAQCNCPYWHGVFGGLYLPHLRGAIYQELIQAENLLQAKRLIESKPIVETKDFDCDGADELLVTTRCHKAIFTPGSGGAIIEFDDFRSKKNLVDVIGRYREGYHHKLFEPQEEVDGTPSIHDRLVTKEDGLEQLLHYDWYRRGLFIDHFFGEETTLTQFAQSQHREEGDFVGETYQHQVESIKQGLRVTLWRQGNLWRGEERTPLEVTKTFRFGSNSDTVSIGYRIHNKHDRPVDLHFGIELVFGGFTFPVTESAIETDGEGMLQAEVEAAVMEKHRFAISSNLYDCQAGFALDQPATIWSHPLWTVSLSEGGFEKVYQGLIVLPHWRFKLAAGKEWKLGMEFFSRLRKKNPLNQPQPAASGQLPT